VTLRSPYGAGTAQAAAASGLPAQRAMPGLDVLLLAISAGNNIPNGYTSGMPECRVGAFRHEAGTPELTAASPAPGAPATANVLAKRNRRHRFLNSLTPAHARRPGLPAPGQAPGYPAGLAATGIRHGEFPDNPDRTGTVPRHAEFPDLTGALVHLHLHLCFYLLSHLRRDTGQPGALIQVPLA
jgi:hypothetical protein